MCKELHRRQLPTDRDNLKSQSGYVYMMDGGAICWKSSKQSVTADSTTEAEYIAVSEAAKEAVWIRRFLEGLKVVLLDADTIPLLYDNSGAVFRLRSQSLVISLDMYSGSSI